MVKMIKTDNVKFPKDTPITPLGKQLIKDFLQKDPEKRIELIEFVTQNYNTMPQEEYDAMYA